MTEDGLIYEKVNGKRVQGTKTGTIKGDLNTSEWIFPATKGKGDYHTQMNNERFMAWVEYVFPSQNKLGTLK